jgi:hypothetical protein
MVLGVDIGVVLRVQSDPGTDGASNTVTQSVNLQLRTTSEPRGTPPVLLSIIIKTYLNRKNGIRRFTAMVPLGR